ncbi:MAG TPA: sigma-70 family RNA polymerase sigma factor [Tepidisphaeraceae bacterium]|nr:sigma-70 family RNA polymerase sigma factor [Tepidisphaeraceae bacterium]
MSDSSTPASDSDLLAEYARSRSADAFGQIVSRYIDIVHAAATRQVHDPHLADDVCQAVFLILSQRAQKISPATSLGGWFILTTQNVARNARRRESRLKRRERKAAEMHGQNESSLLAETSAISNILDQALTRLSETDRNVIIQRFFHAKSHRQVGQIVGISEEAATKRVSRALGRLRELLEQSGVTASEATLLTVLPVIATRPAPAKLVSSIQASLGGSTSPSAIALAKSAGMSFPMVPVAAGIAIVLGIGLLMLLQPSAKPQTAGQAAAPAQQRTITLVAIDPANQQPIASADIQITRDGQADGGGLTDATGRYVFDVPDQFRSLTAVLRAPGHVPMWIAWQNYTLKGGLPPVYTIPLEKGTVIGGLVADQTGSPVSGASITLSMPIDSQDPEKPVAYLNHEQIATDANGRWKFDLAPARFDHLYVETKHPDHPNSGFAGANYSSDELHNFSAFYVFKPSGRTFSGIVRDSSGKPVAGATVIAGDDRDRPAQANAPTDADGKFEITGVAKNIGTAVVNARGFAPQLIQYGTSDKPKPAEVRLDPPSKIEGFVVEANGQPVAGARVEVDQWRGTYALAWNARTDRDGHFEWDQAPGDEFTLTILGKNRSTVDSYRIIPGQPPVRITIYPIQKISGRVVDVETHKPLPQFTMIYGIRWAGGDDVIWQHQDVRTLTDGQYEANIADFNSGGRLRVEADGYVPSSSRIVTASEGNLTIDFELRKGTGPAGVVVDAQDHPQSDTTIYSIATDSFFDLSDGRDVHQDDRVLKTRTDGSGHFSFRATDYEARFLAINDLGMAMVTAADLAKSAKMTIQPWARIEGVLKVGNKTAASTKIGAQIDLVPSRETHKTISRLTTTDSSGHFMIERVPPGKVRLMRVTATSNLSQHYTDLGNYETWPGQTLTVALGGGGRTVMAKVIVPLNQASSVDLVRSLQIRTEIQSQKSIAASLPFPTNYPDMTEDEQKKWMTEFTKSPQFNALVQQRQSLYPRADFIPAADGTIRADDVKPGTYRGHVAIQDPFTPGTTRERNLGSADFTFTVPELNKGDPDEPLDLGQIQLNASSPSLTLGSPLPDLKLVNPNGKPFDINALRGRFVVIHVWSINRTAMFSTIRQIHDRYKDGTGPQILNIAIQLLPGWEDRIAQREGLAGLRTMDANTFNGGDGIDFQRALLIQQAPTALIVAPDGKIIAKDLKSGPELQTAVDQAMTK